MAKEKKNKIFYDFAWLIHSEVEQYINDHEVEYKAWEQEQQQSGEDEPGRENNQKGEQA